MSLMVTLALVATSLGGMLCAFGLAYFMHLQNEQIQENVTDALEKQNELNEKIIQLVERKQ